MIFKNLYNKMLIIIMKLIKGEKLDNVKAKHPEPAEHFQGNENLVTPN